MQLGLLLIISLRAWFDRSGIRSNEPERMNTKGVRKNIYSVKVTTIKSVSQIAS